MIIGSMKTKYYYDGPLSMSKMPPLVKRAYAAWSLSRDRCNNPRNKDYKYYGGKGIRVLYSSREFIVWWTIQFKSKKWKNPTVGRIDHDRDYRFDNIEMQEKVDNSLERIDRVGCPFPQHQIIAIEKNGSRRPFSSMRKAAVFYGLSVSTIGRSTKANRLTKLGVRFEHDER